MEQLGIFDLIWPSFGAPQWGFWPKLLLKGQMPHICPRSHPLGLILIDAKLIGPSALQENNDFLLFFPCSQSKQLRHFFEMQIMYVSCSCSRCLFYDSFLIGVNFPSLFVFIRISFWRLTTSEMLNLRSRPFWKRFYFKKTFIHPRKALAVSRKAKAG